MPNIKSTKNSFVNKFFGINTNKEENLDEPFIIRKKYIKLSNKNLTLKMLDTSNEFHKNSIVNSIKIQFHLLIIKLQKVFLFL